MTKCLNCGAENDPENRFCEECGAALQVTCPQCGEKVGPSTKFCPSCGHRIAGGAPASVAPPTAARPTYQPLAPITPPPPAPSPTAPTVAPTSGYAPYNPAPTAPPPPSYAPPAYGAPTSAPPASAPPPYTPSPSYGASYPAAAMSPAYAAAPPYQAAPVFKYKGVWPRFFALLVDGLIIGIPMSFLMGGVMAREMRSAYPNMTVIYGLSFLTMAVSLAYSILLEAGGGTLGKRILGMKIVDAQGNKPGIGKSLIRNLLRLVDGLFGYVLGAIIVANSPTKQRLGDKAAGTFVVGK